MNSADKAIDDRFATVTPKLAEYQNPNNVHSNSADYEFLSQKVAVDIAAALKIE